VGTSSLRRQAQLMALRPGSRHPPFARQCRYAAAEAGGGRVCRHHLGCGWGESAWPEHSWCGQILPADAMCPAAGQGGSGHRDTAGRRGLQGSNLPFWMILRPALRLPASERSLTRWAVGVSADWAFAEVGEGGLRLRAVVAHPDGTKVLRGDAERKDPLKLGEGGWLRRS